MVVLVNFSGQTIETTVTNDPLTADKWATQILEDQKKMNLNTNIIVGFDCKYSKPVDDVPHPISNKIIATLQLCVGTNCLVLQLLHMELGIFPHSLLHFMNHAKVILFGVEIKENLLTLEKQFIHNHLSVIITSKVVDIRALAKIWFPVTGNMTTCSLRGIAYKVAGLSMRTSSKQHLCNNINVTSVDDWEAGVLRQELIEYAAVDAYVSYIIPHTLLHQI